MRNKLFIALAILFICSVCANATPVDVNIYSDDIIEDGDIYGTVNIYDTPPDQTTVTMTGGNIWECKVYNTANFTVNSGDVAYISAFDYSNVSIVGGIIDLIYLYDMENATVNLYGGNITGFHGMFTAPNKINIYGYDFVGQQIGSEYYLSGKWENNSDFEFYFLRSDGIPDIVSLNIIPEPCTFGLVAFGSLILRRG